jgi:hypothetical protein
LIAKDIAVLPISMRPCYYVEGSFSSKKGGVFIPVVDMPLYQLKACQAA